MYPPANNNPLSKGVIELTDTPPTSRDVELELGELDTATKENRNLTDALAIRLTPLIIPYPAAPPVNKSEIPQAVRCPLADQIREQRYRVEQANRALNELLGTVQL